MKSSISFHQGKQNQDVDERFITNGEYRELVNGRVLDSDKENAGCITSLKGTRVLINETLIGQFSFKAIAVVSHEDLLYVFFSHTYFGNIIKEYNTILNTSAVVFVDANMNRATYPEIFNHLVANTNTVATSFKKFTNITTTSDVTMHVFEGMLFFHDREDEPFKINIAKSKDRLDYYQSKEDITVAKVPPFSPHISINTSSSDIQNFNMGDYKFALRYIYEDGEVSALSPLSSMPIVATEDASIYSAISTSGNAVDSEDVVREGTSLDNYMVGEYTQINNVSVNGAYQLNMATLNVDGGDLYDVEYHFGITKKDSGEQTGTLVFVNLQNLEVSKSVFIAKKSFTDTLPVVTSFSASRKDDGKDILAWTINTKTGAGTNRNCSGLYIYDISTSKGYYYKHYDKGDDEVFLMMGNRGYVFHQAYVTKNGEVFIAAYLGNRFRLLKFDFDKERFSEVIGASSETDVHHHIAKNRVVCSNDNGNIIYYAHSRVDNNFLYQSTEYGKKSSFRLLGNRDLIFADVLTYFKEYKGADQNRWSISTCCSADGLIVYVGCCNCIARSDDAGQTWQSYVIDEDNSTYGAVIDLQCSADGKVVYAIVGVADNEHYEMSYSSELGEITDNSYPLYSGNLYVSLSYGKAFHMVQPNTNTFYADSEPSNSKFRRVSCNDTGETVMAEGWIWSYYKEVDKTDYSLTDFIYVDGATMVYPGSSFVSVDFANNIYPISWKQGIKQYATGGTTKVLEDFKHAFKGKTSIDILYGTSTREVIIDYDSFVAPSLPMYDIKNTTINNNISSVDINFECDNSHIDRVQVIMYNNGNYYIIKDVKRNALSLPINFANDGIYSVLPEKDALKLYDNVPLKVNASDIAQDSLIFGGYTDGYNPIDVTGISVAIHTSHHTNENSSGISLKGGTKYTYGLIAYDKYNRSTGVNIIGSIQTPTIQEAGDYQLKHARITIPESYTFPDWVSHIKFCRTKMSNNYYVINGFDSVNTLGNKIVLEITSNTSVVPKIGDTIELVYDWQNQEYKSIVMPVIGYIDNKSNYYLGEVREDEKLIGEGRYILIADNAHEFYNKTSIIAGNEHYTSSFFYLNSEPIANENVQFYEIPYTFEIVDGTPRNEIYDNADWNYLPTIMQPKPPYSTTYILYGDGDVVIYENPFRELSLLNNNTRFTTLGRVALYSENNKQQNRYASICISEPYVQDTGFNGLSSFNTALVNYKDLDRKYGAIEAVDGLDDKIAVFQKYRCSQVQYKKNVLTTANDSALVTGTQDIFGEQVLYALEYGLTDHHSLVKWGNTRFFADQKRGAVLRIDYNGIHNISDNGMRNYFYKCLSNYTGRILACYDVAHSSYMLFHEVDGTMICDNYLVTTNGWSSKFEIAPDIIVNTMNGVFSFKERILYKHDVTNIPAIYGENKDVILRIPCNEHPDIIKSYNAIQIDSTAAPYQGKFITRTGESTLNSAHFEKVETEYQSYIPMIGSKQTANPILFAVTDKNIVATVATFTISNNVDIHIGDAVIACVIKTGDAYEQIGDTCEIVGLQPNSVTIGGNINFPAGALLFAIDSSQINGYAHKDTSMMIELRFTSATVVKSITVDINESKI